MKVHERFRAAAKGLPADRLPVIEWAGWWSKTVNNWYDECPELKSKQTGGCALHEYLGLDISHQHWFPLKTAATPAPQYHGAPVVASMKEYLEVKRTLYPDPVLDEGFIKYARELHEKGTGIVWFTIEGFFWFPRTLLGIENHLYSFYDEPELYHTICADLLKWQKRAIEVCANALPFDFMTFGEDMSYNNGPMLSKEHFDEFIKPYYKKIVPLIKKAGILTVVDSDGDITKAVDWFAEAGVEGMLPLERQAGVDVSLYLQKQPEMFFVGHFDKMCMKHGEKAMRKEFERLLPSIRKGRFIPSVDHQTPPDVTLENYRIYVKLLKEYTVLR